MQSGIVEMSKAGRLSRFKTRLGRQRGQAYAEYLVVTTALIASLLLLNGDPVSPITALITSFKSLFNAYSFTLSLP